MPSSSSASLLRAAARHEAGHATAAELFAGMRGITQPVIRRIDVYSDGSGGVHYADTPSVPDPLKPRLCIAHTHDLLHSGSPFICDAVCDFQIASSQDLYNNRQSAILGDTLAAVARDILRACGLPVAADFDVSTLYDWLTVHGAAPPHGYSAAFGDGDHAPAGYADAAFFVGSLLAHAGYTDRRAIAADLLVVLAGPAAEGVGIKSRAAQNDRFVSDALFDALHATADFYVSTAVLDATRSEILKILADVLGHPQIRDARQGLEDLLIAHDTIAGDPYAAWAAEVRGLAASPSIMPALAHALDAADTLLIPG